MIITYIYLQYFTNGEDDNGKFVIGKSDVDVCYSGFSSFRNYLFDSDYSGINVL